ncbi:MAG: alpha/beta hydrolase [Pseudazoarcus pumilus]|nr:alpha/beta hydrolase [Pseudazoarcus pumilus]
MDTRRLEHIVRTPQAATRAQPLLFVHGAYTGAWCWDEHFLPYFAQHGYAAHAISLSGHGGSEGRERLDSLRLADYVEDVVTTIDALSAAPVLIGHSMGGLVVQKVLEQRSVPGAALLCAVPPHGLGPSAMRMLVQQPGLLVTLNALLAGREPALEHVREALFHQPIDHADLTCYVRRCQPESARALWDMTAFDLPRPQRMQQVPLLILGAEHDRLIPPGEVEATGRALGTPAEILPGFGHALMLEPEWERAAQRILEWLDLLVPAGAST